MYIVQLKSGLLWRRHINQLRDGIQISTEVLVNTPPNNTAHTSLDDSAHASVGDTVEVATPSVTLMSQTQQRMETLLKLTTTHRELIVLLISI